MLVTDLHARAPADDIIHLVFAMGFLWIAAALGQCVDAGAQGRNAQKFQVEFSLRGALAIEVIKMEKMVHGMQLKTGN